MNICHINGPFHWANALVNGDQSDLTVDEVIKLNAWRTRKGIKAVLGTTDYEPRFTWSYRLHAPECDCDGGSVLTYICDVQD